MKSAIAKAPISIAVLADSYWDYYKSGNLLSAPITNKYSVNHAVIMYGYNTTHWFLRNSWSTSWGVKGDGFIPINPPAGYGNSNCNSYMWGVVPV